MECSAIKGIAACARGPAISHLVFADDNLIFCWATNEECSNITILETYEHELVQQLNRDKTPFFFSRNTPQPIQDDIKNRFGAKIIKQYERYLGLPSLVGKNKYSKNKYNTFHQLIERSDNKLSGWKEKLLSNASKEILIKCVAQAMPTYTISVFKLPNTLCDEMTTMVHKF